VGANLLKSVTLRSL